uniref:Putative radical SAM superfamily protein n=1 Tax=viral metagenome TaxID=1070528 RepID=A0A6M3L1Q5_9ZZZZ
MDDRILAELERLNRPELTEYITAKMIRPDEVHLESSSRCNADCIMCPREGMKRFKGEMSKAIFLKVVDGLQESPPVILHFHLNGEPMMMKTAELVSRMNHAKEKLPGTRMLFFTNASLLDEEATLRLLDSALNEICFSFDGGTKEDYEAIRRGLSFDKVFANIEHFQKENIKRGKKIRTHAFIVPQQRNATSIDRFHALFNSLAIDDVGGSGVQNIGGRIDAESLKVKNLQYNKGSIKAPCWRVFQDIDVMADGKVPVCCQDVHGDFILADAKKQNILDIWRGNALNDVRVMHLLGKQSELPFCKGCDFMIGFVAPEWWPRND